MTEGALVAYSAIDGVKNGANVALLMRRLQVPDRNR
jgi:hypothetical protein